MTTSCSFTLSPDEFDGSDAGRGIDSPWDCPHDSHDEAEFCLFHLAPERRTALDITETEVRDAFLAAVREGARLEKQFIGAQFDSLDLGARTLDTGDRFPIDLRHAVIEDELGLTRSSIDHPLRLEGASVGRLVASEATFGGDLSLAGARIGEGVFERADVNAPATFEDVTIERGVTFRSVTFDGHTSFADASIEDATFAETTFAGDVSFRGTAFVTDADFAGAEFTGGANVEADDADFTGTTFEAAARFEMARFRAGTFDGATFAGETTFERATFDRTSSFADASFEDDADFTRCSFDGNVSFERGRFEATTGFEEIECEGDAIYGDAVFEAPVTFAGAEFRGGSNLLVDDADFSATSFEAPADFHMTRFRFAGFEGATFAATARFESADFVRGGTFADVAFGADAEFTDCTFDGRATVDDATVDGDLLLTEAVFNDDATFESIRVGGDAALDGVEFRGGANVAVDDADFSGARFEGGFDCEHASVRWARFDGAQFEGPVRAVDASFERGCSATGVVVEDELDCYRARFDGDTTFEDARIEQSRFDETVFADDVSFSGVAFTGPASFRGVEFRGGANIVVDDADFSGATFDDEATFRDAEFRHARFDETEFASPPSFDQATFARGASFEQTILPSAASFADIHVARRLSFDPIPSGEATLVDMRAAALEHGEIVRSNGAAVYYDLTEATLGAVKLIDDGGETPLFDHFLFSETAFEEFDFSRHRDYLERNAWEIHRLDESFRTAADADVDHEFSPQDLEATYLKAKNGASAVGDNKATSEFFMKEMAYRRRRYSRVLLGNANGGALSKPRSLGKWLTNAFFDATCGYGERPSRVVVVSTVIIGVFTLPYAILGVDIADSQVADPLIYSLMSFTSLVLDPPRGANAVVNTLTAFEGFIGGFFIALFVFALTRSLHR